MNLCNRSNEEVQQILLSQFSDDEVEIVYLNMDKFAEAYTEVSPDMLNDKNIHNLKDYQDPFNTFADMNKHGNQPSSSTRYASDVSKGSIRRKMSLSSIAAAMWSK